MDTSETVTGDRKRAPAEKVADSDIPIQTQETRRRAGDLLSAFIAEK